MRAALGQGAASLKGALLAADQKQYRATLPLSRVAEHLLRATGEFSLAEALCLGVVLA